MQIFLPYKSFKKSAEVLDYQRLGKQRVEALQIINIIEGNPRKDGLPYKLISKTIPSIEAEINSILSQIVTFSIALDVDGKNFGGRIVYDHERSWPLENSSGMERFISSLAIRVALLKASNLPKSNFLIIDEGMGSLDTEFLHGMQLKSYEFNKYKTKRENSDININICFRKKIQRKVWFKKSRNCSIW